MIRQYKALYIFTSFSIINNITSIVFMGFLGGFDIWLTYIMKNNDSLLPLQTIILAICRLGFIPALFILSSYRKRLGYSPITTNFKFIVNGGIVLLAGISILLFITNSN